MKYHATRGGGFVPILTSVAFYETTTSFHQNLSLGQLDNTSDGEDGAV